MLPEHSHKEKYLIGLAIVGVLLWYFSTHADGPWASILSPLEWGYLFVAFLIFCGLLVLFRYTSFFKVLLPELNGIIAKQAPRQEADFRRCPFCKEGPIQPDAVVCRYCHRDLDARCAACLRSIPKDAKFCPYCASQQVHQPTPEARESSTRESTESETEATSDRQPASATLEPSLPSNTRLESRQEAEKEGIEAARVQLRPVITLSKVAIGGDIALAVLLGVYLLWSFATVSKPEAPRPLTASPQSPTGEKDRFLGMATNPSATQATAVQAPAVTKYAPLVSLTKFKAQLDSETCDAASGQLPRGYHGVCLGWTTQAVKAARAEADCLLPICDLKPSKTLFDEVFAVSDANGVWQITAAHWPAAWGGDITGWLAELKSKYGQPIRDWESPELTFQPDTPEDIKRLWMAAAARSHMRVTIWEDAHTKVSLYYTPPGGKRGETATLTLTDLDSHPDARGTQ